MKKIIVTVTENGGHFSYDMELPTDIPMRLVQKDIIDNLSLLYPSFPFFRREWALVCERTGVSPDLESTAGESGVWNGDYLVLTEVQRGPDHSY